MSEERRDVFMGRLADKAAIVTGGGSGIGKATAVKLAEEGASVVVTDVNATTGHAAVEEIGGRAVFINHDALIIDFPHNEVSRVKEYSKAGFTHSGLGKFPLKLTRLKK